MSLPKMLEVVVGSLDDKRQYREYKARIKALPAEYRKAAEAFDHYVMIAGGVAKSDVLIKMISDLADLWEEAAADRTPIRTIVGDDPVEFAEDFLKNYSDGSWISKERAKLTRAIDEAAAPAGPDSADGAR